MIAYAEGNVIDMKETLNLYPIRLIPLTDYVKQVMQPVKTQ
jgi:hypothetical protein